MNEAMIEALYQNEMAVAKRAYDNAVKDAEEARARRLKMIEDKRRDEYRFEQQFFFQG